MTDVRVVQYNEKLSPAPWMFVATALVIPASMLVLAPISLVAGVITAIVLYGALVVLMVGTAPSIRISGGVLRVGSASVPLSVIGEPTAFDGDEAFEERGQRLDARAWLMLRGWVKPVIKVPLNDPDDPTPYWLLSTRRPKDLVAAIRRSQRP